MKLAIFDLDGTLVKISEVEAGCFRRLLEEEFGRRRFNSNWGEYPHVTLTGIATQIYQERWGRLPSPQDLSRMRERFLNLLREATRPERGKFVEVPGAGQIVRQLAREPDWQLAIATGGWREVGQLKLAQAGIPVGGIPMASANEGFSREAIVTAAIAQARQLSEIERFQKIVSIGDGIWDVKTARQLGIAFLGVQGVASPEELRQAGAGQVLPDFSQVLDVKEVLESATLPGLGKFHSLALPLVSQQVIAED